MIWVTVRKGRNTIVHRSEKSRPDPEWRKKMLDYCMLWTIGDLDMDSYCHKRETISGANQQ